MPALLEKPDDGDTIELRVYIKVSKRGHPELASLMEGLNKREQSRLVKALVIRGAMASAQPVSVAANHDTTAYASAPSPGRSKSETDSVASVVERPFELMDGLTPDDLASGLGFAMGSTAIANP
ncbi:MAG: hypothetical protein Q8N17_06175 [Burkholderiaceae bacterium]|nr:hypothetical protein [Burkholderiaceae bacterium]